MRLKESLLRDSLSAEFRDGRGGASGGGAHPWRGGSARTRSGHEKAYGGQKLQYEASDTRKPAVGRGRRDESRVRLRPSGGD